MGGEIHAAAATQYVGRGEISRAVGHYRRQRIEITRAEKFVAAK